MLIMWLAMAGCYIEARDEGVRYLANVHDSLESRDGATQAVAAWNGLSLAHAALGDVEQARSATAAARTASETLLRHRLLAPSVHSNYARLALTYAADDPAERRRLLAECAFFSKRNQSQQAFVDERFLERAPELPLLFAMGKWDEARQLAVTFVEAYGADPVGESGRDLIGNIAHAQGDAGRAWQVVRSVWPDGPATVPGPRFVVPAMSIQRLAVRLALDVGDLATAQAWLEAHDRWLAWSSIVPGRSEGHTLWAWYDYRRGATDRAMSRARNVLAMATSPRQPLALVAAHRLLAALEGERGHIADAHGHLNEAATLATACEAEYERALSLLVKAQVCLTDGDHTGSETALTTVRSICEPLGARLALAEASRLAEQIDGPEGYRESRPDGLSAREVEVLRLMASGLSNQAIADTLSLSVRTVERHLTNAYGKIDAPGRTAAVAYALRHLM
jgi:DNA-binding CsgD family transcriptional regulator